MKNSRQTLPEFSKNNQKNSLISELGFEESVSILSNNLQNPRIILQVFKQIKHQNWTNKKKAVLVSQIIFKTKKNAAVKKCIFLKFLTKKFVSQIGQSFVWKKKVLKKKLSNAKKKLTELQKNSLGLVKCHINLIFLERKINWSI